MLVVFTEQPFEQLVQITLFIHQSQKKCWNTREDITSATKLNPMLAKKLEKKANNITYIKYYICYKKRYFTKKNHLIKSPKI